MAGIYIKGMEMPTSKEGVAVIIYPDGNAVVEPFDIGFSQYCEAIPVPDHGRLIDADALLEWANADLRFGDPDFHAGLWHTIIAIEDAPTIIPTEEEETT